MIAKNGFCFSLPLVTFAIQKVNNGARVRSLNSMVYGL